MCQNNFYGWNEAVTKSRGISRVGCYWKLIIDEKTPSQTSSKGEVVLQLRQNMWLPTSLNNTGLLQTMQYQY